MIEFRYRLAFSSAAYRARPASDPHHRQAVAGRDSAHDRGRTLNLIALSGTFFQRDDDIAEGVTMGDQALGGAGTLTSPRTLERLGR